MPVCLGVSRVADTTTKAPSQSAAILYDFMQVRGGAEAVTLGLCEHFPELQLITAFVNQSAFPTSPIPKERITTLAHPTAVQGWQTIQGSTAFRLRTRFLGQYDTLIFSGAYAPLAIHNSQAVQNIYYCHTPPRFVYDLKDYYLKTIPQWQRPLLKALVRWYQPQYEAALQKMDVVYANSVNTQQRLKRFIGIESSVLYPPCDLEGYQFVSQGDYYLSTARLEPYKRVDVIVEAFKRMPHKKLIVTSGGSQLQSLKALAAGATNIQFTDWVTKKKLQDLVRNCLATIYIPKDEDFGISPVQSMAAGKPVIGVNEGGVAETVQYEQTGYLMDADPSADDLVHCIEGLSNTALADQRHACEGRAQRFDSHQFYEQFGQHLNKVQ
jgi:glycosyltransferase involved in cell wall biosynthesis